MYLKNEVIPILKVSQIVFKKMCQKQRVKKCVSKKNRDLTLYKYVHYENVDSQKKWPPNNGSQQKSVRKPSKQSVDKNEPKTVTYQLSSHSQSIFNILGGRLSGNNQISDSTSPTANLAGATPDTAASTPPVPVITSPNKETKAISKKTAPTFKKKDANKIQDPLRPLIEKAFHKCDPFNIIAKLNIQQINLFATSIFLSILHALTGASNPSGILYILYKIRMIYDFKL